MQHQQKYTFGSVLEMVNSGTMETMEVDMSDIRSLSGMISNTASLEALMMRPGPTHCPTTLEMPDISSAGSGARYTLFNAILPH